MKRNTLIIINPISGGVQKDAVPALVKEYLSKHLFETRIQFTEKAKHGYELALEAYEQGTDLVIAVGGDGTINEIAQAAVEQKGLLGLIPLGSGNGLARSLHIPMRLVNAIKHLNRADEARIDTGLMNGKHFFNVSGMGFDAYISKTFQTVKGRGLKGYAQALLSKAGAYKPEKYIIKTDHKTIEKEAYVISFANSSQYGNNIHIAPKASLHDGKLDICIISAFPKILLPSIGFKMLNKTIHESKYVQSFQTEKVQVIREHEGWIHLDGEPHMMGKEIEVSIDPSSLRILC